MEKTTFNELVVGDHIYCLDIGGRPVVDTITSITKKGKTTMQITTELHAFNHRVNVSDSYARLGGGDIDCWINKDDLVKHFQFRIRQTELQYNTKMAKYKEYLEISENI